MFENLEKNITKREKMPLEVSRKKIESSKKYIEKLDAYTKQVKYKYPGLKDFTQAFDKLVKEKGKEYNFEKILIEKKSPNPLNEGGIRILGPFPSNLIIPEIIFANYEEFKEFTPENYKKTTIKKIGKHEKEHYLMGPAAKFKHKIFGELNELAEQKKGQEKRFLITEKIERLIGGQGEEMKKIEAEFRKLDYVEKLMKPFLTELLEQQAELQSTITDEEIEETAIHISNLNMWYLGTDYAFALAEKMPKYRQPYWNYRYSTIFPSLSPNIRKNLVKKHLEIEDEIKEKYEKWKEKTPKSNQNKSPHLLTGI